MPDELFAGVIAGCKEISMLKRAKKALGVLAIIAGLAGLAFYLAMFIPIAAESIQKGDTNVFIFPVVTLLLGGPMLLGGLLVADKALPFEQTATTIFYLFGFVLSLFLARALYRSVLRWAIFSFLVPYFPPLILGVMALRKERIFRPPVQAPYQPASAAAAPAARPVPSVAVPPKPFIASKKDHAAHMATVLDWCRRHMHATISVDVISRFETKEMTMHRAQGAICAIAQHPAKPGLYRIEFDSRVQGPNFENDFITLGFEVSGVSDQGERLTIQKGPNQRIEMAAV
jgi:hypothetical protein